MTLKFQPIELIVFSALIKDIAQSINQTGRDYFVKTKSINIETKDFVFDNNALPLL